MNKFHLAAGIYIDDYLKTTASSLLWIFKNSQVFQINTVA